MYYYSLTTLVLDLNENIVITDVYVYSEEKRHVL